MNKAAATILGIALAATVGLAGCSKGHKTDAEATPGGSAQGELGDAIVVDPTMTAEGPANGAALSPADRGPEAAARARKAAVALAGAIQPLPAAIKGSAAPLSQAAATAAQITPAARAAKTDCAAKAQYAKGWAGKLPAEFPLYPQASVQEAAGADIDGCALRVVSFGTPVDQQDVIGFYRAMALKAGYTADYRVDGGDQVLGGRKGGLAYVVYARRQGSGATEVDLVTSGR